MGEINGQDMGLTISIRHHFPVPPHPGLLVGPLRLLWRPHSLPTAGERTGLPRLLWEFQRGVLGPTLPLAV